MSMHLRGSRDMMGRDESWWQSRTGLEQKLVILSTVLFILSFSLTISVIVLKNRSSSAPAEVTTVSPVTGEASTASEEPTSPPTGEPTQSTASDVTDSSTSEVTASTITEVTAPSTASEVPATSESTITEASTSASTESTLTDAPSTATTTKPAEEPKGNEEEPKDDKVEAAGPGSINNRPARYVSPRALSNLNGA